MKKLLVFDLDGVLIDAKNIHYKALNDALKKIDEKYTINLNEHLSTYDGLSTRLKLKKLSIEKSLPYDKHDIVWNDKQKFTNEKICKIKKDDQLIVLIDYKYYHNY